MKNKSIKTRLKRIYASTVLFMLVGVFLLPQYAFASTISDENIINLTNTIREEQGLNSLSANQLLSKAAYDKAQAIFESGSFKHNLDGKKFSTWVKDTGYQYKSVGENLAIDFVTSEGTMSAWLDSPSHKENLLNPKFQEIGVAVVKDEFEGRESLLVVQIFGTPDTPEIVPTKKANPLLESPDSNISQADPAFLDNTAPNTLVKASIEKNLIKEGNKLENLELYGQEYLSMQFIEESIIYILDYTNIYMMNYYYTVIALMLLVFSSAFIWHKKVF